MRLIVSALCLSLAVLTAAPATADIAAFNKAVLAGNYKAAATEAAATWPMLEKTSADIGVIAREFGFAAYIAKDYAAMRTYAAFAADPTTPGGDPLSSSVATVMLRTAEHKLTPTAQTRQALAEALTRRSALVGLDNITVVGIDVLVAYDIEKGDWKNLAASTDTGMKLAKAGGQSMTLLLRRLELNSTIAAFLDTKTPAVYDRFIALRDAILSDIDAAPSTERAADFVPLNWEVAAWKSMVITYLNNSGKRIPRKVLEEDAERQKAKQFSARVIELIRSYNPDKSCATRVKLRHEIEYPPSALFKGYVGSVFVQVDIDADGNARNPRIMASVPDKLFGEAVLRSLGDIKFVPGKDWDKKMCKLERTNFVVEFAYQL